jgi:hypothetical protein
LLTRFSLGSSLFSFNPHQQDSGAGGMIMQNVLARAAINGCIGVTTTGVGAEDGKDEVICKIIVEINGKSVGVTAGPDAIAVHC